MRKTKIVCTIGPACDNKETLSQMCLAGMNVARLNFSHGTHESHRREIELLREVRTALRVPLAIMLDTKGPEYRIGLFKNGKEMLEKGDAFTFTVEDVEGDATRVSVSYKDLPAEMQAGDRVLVNNGLLIFEVEEVEFTACNNFDGENYLIYEPSYPWHMSKADSSMTEERIEEILRKYISIVTNQMPEMDYQSVGNGG
jgi:pyruvate kinase